MPVKALYQWVEWCGAVVAIATVGCARTPVASDLQTGTGRCVLAQATGQPAESLTLALPAPSATAIHWDDDPVARLVDGRRYEPLIRVDCTGSIIPALAESWDRDTTGRRWTFTLRDGARLSDGTPVTTRDIVASWRVNTQGIAWSPAFARVTNVEGFLTHYTSRVHRELGLFLADSARIIDARTMVVTLPDTAIRLLSNPGFALRVRGVDEVESLGTGTYELVTDSAGPRLRPRAMFPDAPRIRLIRTSTGTDPRDLLDAGTDLLFTEDPSVVRYASAHPGLDAVPLPLRRVYVLVSTAALAGEAAGDSSGSGERSLQAAALRAELARDVVPARARPAEGRYWWNALAGCAVTTTGRAHPHEPARGRIVHDQGDPVSGALAQRLVAVASGASASDAAALEALAPALRSSPTPLVALGLASDAFAEALRSAEELAFIVPLPVRPVGPCQAMAPFGETLGGRATVVLTPLIEAGGWAIVRRGRITLEIDWDGSIHMGSASAPSVKGGR